MRKLLLIVFSISLINTNFSQYTYSLNPNTGNPGALNTDNEYPFGGGLDPSWTVILGPSQTTPAWSSIETIPFSFNFNGVAVTQYKVSSTGVLTFSTTTTPVPGAGNAALPSTSIPDASILVWGIQGTGTNDNIVSKTFGTPGSQQHWVFFSSYDGGGSWSYWSIVLEESTDNIYIVDQRHAAAAAPLITAGIQINSSAALMVTGSPSLSNLASTDATPADNRYYEFNFSSASCSKPYGFLSSNITTNSVDLSWIGSANALSYNIEYGTSGFSQGNGTYFNDTSNSYSFTGLLPSQFYDVYIQAVCDSSDSSLWAGPVTFSTLCIENAPYLENFDNSFPNCFSQTSNDIFNWTLNSGTTASTATGPTDDITGNGDYIYIEASAPRVPDDSAVVYSPFIDKSSLTNSKLTFYTHMYGTSIGTLRIDVSDDGGSTYSTIYSKSGDQGNQWNFETVSLAGFSDTLRFKISATVGDDGSGTQWFGDIAIDNFEISEALAIDVAGVSLATNPTLALTNAPFTISGELNNRGINTVTSMDINYTIDGGSLITQSLTNLNFITGDNYSFNHSSTWNPSSSGTYTVEIWASNINGANDMNLSNDRISKSITVASNLALRRPMLESFTSSTCGPCAPGNVNVSGVLQGYQDNQYSILKYQVQFPGAGDPYYTDEVGDRRTYYSVNSVPDLVVDGNEWQDNSSSLTSQIVDNSIAKPSFIDLSSTYSIGGQTVDFQVTIDPLGNFTNFTLYAAIFEYITFNNTGTNGETEFEYVMKKMVPGSSGSNLNSLQDGVQRVENLSYTFNGNYILPPDANSPVNHAINHTVEDFDELGVIVWIQDDATKEILQSTTASLVTSVIENNSPASKLMIFPNPTSNLATIAFEGFENSDIEISLVNLLGEVVFSKKVNSSAYLDYYNLDVSLLSNGIYNVVAKSNGKITTKKLQILK